MSEDFAALLDAQEAQGAVRNLHLEPGDKVGVEVIHIGEENVFVSVSPTQEGSIARAEFLDKDGALNTAVGKRFDAFVLSAGENIELTVKLGQDRLDLDMLEAAKQGGIPIDGTVTGTNTGGLEVSIAGGRAFCPISQVALDYVEDPSSFVGQTLAFKIVEVKESGRNIVLSRRALLEAERATRGAALRERLEVGVRLDGVVRRVAAFGAFVDMGGLDGLIPISELSHRRIGTVEEVVNVGDSVQVEVLRIEPDPKHPGKERIALSLRATQEDPFHAFAASLQENQILQGTITQIKEFGAFVRVEGEVEGLVHISELADRHIGHPSEIVKVGEDVTVRVLKVSLEEKRLSLSLKEAVETGRETSVGGTGPRIGDLVTGIVERHESFGVFVKLQGTETSALLPAAETGTERGTDLRRAFPVDATLELVVQRVDDRGLVRVSKKSRAQAEERQQMHEYRKASKRSSSMGTLGDLLKAHLPK